MMASSDLSQIYKLLGNSLSGEESIRKDAEGQLEQVCYLWSNGDMSYFTYDW